jgi:hypothetical protein
MPRRVNVGTRGTAQFGAILLGTTSPILIFRGGGAPTDGTSGTGAGDANPGSKYVDTTNFAEYINIGTKASPVWLLLGGPGVILFATIAVTNAELLALRAAVRRVDGARRVSRARVLGQLLSRA